MLIKEIILENFMSYEYARITLGQGVNLVCGPNGSGKSSILLAISVALGQSYTERSKKLSDLIRWGKDVGRVTIVLDNSKKQNLRSMYWLKKDEIYLTRVIRNDGKYWFEINNTHATKAEVLRMLSNFGIDPENMLIIMHQDMAERFLVLSPQDKLRLVEEATGLESYRRNIIEAQQKLNQLISQEESLENMIESARQTLAYWREQYEFYQKKQHLTLKRRFSERELAWAEVTKIENNISELKDKINNRLNDLKKIETKSQSINKEVMELKRRSKEKKSERNNLLNKRVSLEIEKAKQESNVKNIEDRVKENKSWISEVSSYIKIINDSMILLENTIKGSSSFMPQLGKIESYSKVMISWLDKISSKSKSLQKSSKDFMLRIEYVDNQICELITAWEENEIYLEELYESIIEDRIESSILRYKKGEIQEELVEMEKDLKTFSSKLNNLFSIAKEKGGRIAVLRESEKILAEIRTIDGHISALADIPAEVERMYESYSELYLELTKKAKIAADNRAKGLEEIKKRMRAWNKVIRNLLSHVNDQFQHILSEARAIGSVHLINDHGIEETGLEIFVGFKGSKPTTLDIYSQSGGERSTTIMAFLLALQQRVKSPFRAIDEYDVHMDPKNRELIANILMSGVAGDEAQYLAITPNQMYFEEQDTHLITVQNISGTSFIMGVD